MYEFAWCVCLTEPFPHQNAVSGASPRLSNNDRLIDE